MLVRMGTVKPTFIFLVLAIGILGEAAAATNRGTVLIYTRNGPGYVHSNIAASTGAAGTGPRDTTVEVSEDPADSSMPT